MKTLITPAQVLHLAFGEEYLAPETISTADIAAAEQRHLVPVVGRDLYEKLLAGGYAEFTAEYLAPAIASFVRAAVQPRLDVRTGRCGTTAPRSQAVQPASDASLRRLRSGIRAQARVLLRRASDHLAAQPAQFPEYDFREDILNRCTIDGNLVQIR